MKKYIHQKSQHYNYFIDFKKSVVRELYDFIWHTMNMMGIHIDLINIIKSLYDYIIRYILLNNKSGLPFTMNIGER